MCCYSRPWTVTAFWFSVPERLSNHPSAELSFLNSFSPDANTLSSVFRIIYCMIWKSFHRRQISNGNLWCCFTFCYVLFFLIFLFIWSHFVVFQLLLLPFVLFHIHFEYPLCSIMQSVQVVYLPHCYSLEPSIQVCLFVLSGFSLDSVCVIFTLTFSLIVWFCVFELFLFCFVFVFFAFQL